MQIFEYNPPNLPWLDIRYQDRDIIVINKPSGLLSNPGIAAHTFDCALTRLQQIEPKTILVHRLDCATSGIMVFAKNKKAESHIKTQFQNRLSKKVYIAEVMGKITQEQGCINFAIAANKDKPPLQKVCESGKEAITAYKVLEYREFSTLVELKPTTGRTHQLRVHLQALGHPILGDDFYGNKACEEAASRLHLHAQSLEIIHPYTQKVIKFISDCSF
ncbi:RluA family pseudouridine synthase [Shewanella gelidii]|uniref:Pseudouridine synthase n=1 Tax=Shewanella gelidii TaxID=1642821 RepID=A0A917JTF4_9GAMM|nr:RluA family pseudouridine synthase [Shewanella gelidii]MCL1098193.1 RluA family pseudouridine synthase [Shewanella gelidii]GGI83259.1 RNA pseudouridine synthase [Shewanella gelidii]